MCPPIPVGSDETGVSRTVTPDYFRALNISIIRGRDFRDEDRTGNQSEVILSRLMAATLFGNEDPIGKRLQTIGVHGGASEVVVGVAENVKNKGLTEQSEPEMYTFRRSLPDDWSGNRPRFETALLAFFACAGLTLAVVGLYGLMAFLTAQRNHEIGSGWRPAQHGKIFFVTGDGLRMVTVGGVIGLATALAISRLLKTLLF
jgi:putative ABC transport system permease protein